MDAVVFTRFKQMRKGAKASRKVVPSFEQLEQMTERLLADGMKCPICQRLMNWLLSEGKATVVSLQHDRSGAIRLMCKGCNSRHAQHPGDTFYDVPTDHKRCPKCEEIKPLFEFRNRLSPCKPCERAAALAYYHTNREQCKARNSAWKKANGYTSSGWAKNNRARATENERRRRQRKRESAGQQ